MESLLDDFPSFRHKLLDSECSQWLNSHLVRMTISFIDYKRWLTGVG